MATTWTMTRLGPPADAILDIHPAIISKYNLGGASTAYSGAYRAVLASVVAAGTYVTGGDTDFPNKAAGVGIRTLEAVFMLTDTDPVATAGMLRWDAANGKMKLFTAAGVEVANAAGTVGTYRVLLLGKG